MGQAEHVRGCQRRALGIFISVHQESDLIACHGHSDHCIKSVMPKTWLTSWPRVPGRTWSFRVDFKKLSSYDPQR